ncbi:uncharacterized protein V1516DRAFT_30337 [Lipomyces oligophaga]|uniref:uncharacterized protein n=1 Tax=Lipomyces oligophaga TaxID=45792 RepID=UPI0034CE50DF
MPIIRSAAARTVPENVEKRIMKSSTPQSSKRISTISEHGSSDVSFEGAIIWSTKRESGNQHHTRSICLATHKSGKAESGSQSSKRSIVIAASSLPTASSTTKVSYSPVFASVIAEGLSSAEIEPEQLDREEAASVSNIDAASIKSRGQSKGGKIANVLKQKMTIGRKKHRESMSCSSGRILGEIINSGSNSSKDAIHNKTGECFSSKVPETTPYGLFAAGAPASGSKRPSGLLNSRSSVATLAASRMPANATAETRTLRKKRSALFERERVVMRSLSSLSLRSLQAEQDLESVYEGEDHGQPPQNTRGCREQGRRTGVIFASNGTVGGEQ